MPAPSLASGHADPPASADRARDARRGRGGARLGARRRGREDRWSTRDWPENRGRGPPGRRETALMSDGRIKGDAGPSGKPLRRLRRCRGRPGRRPRRRRAAVASMVASMASPWCLSARASWRELGEQPARRAAKWRRQGGARAERSGQRRAATGDQRSPISVRHPRCARSVPARAAPSHQPARALVGAPASTPRVAAWSAARQDETVAMGGGTRTHEGMLERSPQSLPNRLDRRLAGGGRSPPSRLGARRGATRREAGARPTTAASLRTSADAAARGPRAAMAEARGRRAPASSSTSRARIARPRRVQRRALRVAARPPRPRYANGDALRPGRERADARRARTGPSSPARGRTRVDRADRRQARTAGVCTTTRPTLETERHEREDQADAARPGGPQGARASRSAWTKRTPRASVAAKPMAASRM